MLLALCSRVGPQNLLSSPDTRDTIDWKNEDIEHIGSLLNLFDEVGMLANKSLSVFRLCEGADTTGIVYMAFLDVIFLSQIQP